MRNVNPQAADRESAELNSVTLVLVPGMDGTGRLFAGLLSELPPALGVKIVEYPTRNFLSYQQLVPVVKEAFPKSGPFVLIAESFSTPLAAKLAAERPPNLVGLIMCAGFIASPVGRWSVLVRALAQPWLFVISPPRWVLEYFLVGSRCPDALHGALREALRIVNPAVLAQRLRATLECDGRDDLARTEVPMLYIQAENDRLVRPERFSEIQRIRPNIVLAKVPGPHLILQREPKKSAAAIVRFIRTLMA
jgi:pimeloyl-[acyl-carrier protein] methyl ester esterase